MNAARRVLVQISNKPRLCPDLCHHNPRSLGRLCASNTRRPLSTIRSRTLTTSANAALPEGGTTNRGSTFFTGLLLLGIGATAYGLFSIYDTLTMWPPEIRKDLRSGLHARNKGDLELSAQYLQRAWETAKTLPIDLFKSDPYLKISGIAITLAEVLEQNNNTEAAYQIYTDAIGQFPGFDKVELLSTPPISQERLYQVSEPEKLRAISIAYKLGVIAEQLGKPSEVEWLCWAVEGILKEMMEPKENLELYAQLDQPKDKEVDLILPTWATSVDIAAPFEALGTYYSKVGNTDYAILLYSQAVHFLFQSPETMSIEDRCRGAQVLNNLGEVVVRGNLSPKMRKQAEAWLINAISIATKALESRQKSGRTIDPSADDACEITIGVALYNMGVLREMDDDAKTARKFFQNSLDQFKALQHPESIAQVEAALKRLDGGDVASSGALPPSRSP